MKRRTITTALLASPALALPAFARADTAFLYMGSGSEAGLYDPTAAGMANIVNGAQVPARVYVRNTGGSVDNCQQVASGKLQLALTQNDIAYYAYHGRGVAAFDGKPQGTLRGVAVLYPEVLHILAHGRAGIASVADLRGKRVYVGDANSGTQENAKHVLAAWGMTPDDLKAAVRGRSQDAVNLFANGQLDAMFYTVGVGSRAVAKALEVHGARLLPVPVDKAKALHAQYPFYTAFTIEPDTYPDMGGPVSALALKAMLITSAGVANEAVHTLMQTVFETQLAQFQANPLNPNLKKYFSVQKALDGMPIPLHAGAVRFFQDRGIAIPSLEASPQTGQ